MHLVHVINNYTCLIYKKNTLIPYVNIFNEMQNMCVCIFAYIKAVQLL